MSYTPSHTNFMLPHQPVTSDVRPDYQLHHYDYASIQFTIELTRVDATTWRVSVLMTGRPFSRTERVNIHKMVSVTSDRDITDTILFTGFELNNM